MDKPALPTPPPRERMPPHVQRYRDWLDMVPGAPLYRTEFGYYCLDRWKEQGLPDQPDFQKLFHYDPPAHVSLGHLGWTEAEFVPRFEDKVLEDRGDHELVQDSAGRGVLFFKGRRNGFMPEYVTHPVRDRRTWEEDVKGRLDPSTPARYADIPRLAREYWLPGVREGQVVIQGVSGGYMYLRSLIGPADLCLAVYDMPDVVHACMEAWLDLALAWTARAQEHVAIDVLFFGEDICYNHGPLISPAMMNEFLFPYYRALRDAIAARQPGRRLRISLDTDGFGDPVVDIYRRELGLDVMSPWEAASDCDVVRAGRRWPWLAMYGGIDKRVLARGRGAIDRMVERILPAMRERGGYYPTCDHGVPEEVPLADYHHYRQRCLELGG